MYKAKRDIVLSMTNNDSFVDDKSEVLMLLMM